MKILALRVRNLASLAGPVDIDFEAQPLAHAGLFAITGPTGAGKSTLLDALCLALYDRLPRLATAARAEIGRAGDDGRIAGDDVRTILRHGAAEGSAEVDFQGRDGGRYRARWEVRRARGKAAGRLQAQTLSLVDLGSGAALGGGKRETLEAIRDKAGLDYDQFRRSVLLAQNEFDAFLKARPGERAELLELMTGTGIYGELSVAAHERCKTEKARLDALDDELARVNVLADDQRAALEAEAAQTDAECLRLAAAAEALSRDAQWYRTESDLRTRISEAEARALAAAQALAEAAPESRRLAEVKRALVVRPLVAEADRLAAERDRCVSETGAARAETTRTSNALTLAAAARDKAREQEDAAEAGFRAASPDLDHAAELDARIAEGAGRVERCRAQGAASAAQVTQAESNLDALLAEHATAQAKVTDIEGWLERNRARQTLAEQLDRWLDAIAEHRRASDEARTASAAATHAAERLSALAAERQGGLDHRTELDAAVEQTEAALAELSAGLDTADMDGLEARREALGRLADALARVESEDSAVRTLTGRLDELTARRTSLDGRLREAGTHLASTAARKATLDAQLAEARRSRDLAEAAEGEQAALLRERLVEAEPCPVCGSRDHPLGNVTSALTALLDDMRRRVRELEAQADEAAAQRQHWLAVQVSAGDGLAQCDADLAALAQQAEAATGRLAEARAAVSRQAEALGLVAPHLESCERERAAIAQQLKDLREKRQRADEQARRVAALKRERAALAERLGEMAAQAAAAEADAQRAAADGQRARATVERVAALLEQALAAVPNWHQGLEQAPAELAERCRRLAEEWRRGLSSLETGREAARNLASKAEAARVGLDNARRNADTDARLLADETAALAALRHSRAGLFDGRPTTEVRTGLNEARKAAKAGHEQAQQAFAAAGIAHGMAEARAAQLAARLAELDSQGAAALAARDARMAELGLALAAIREAADLGDSWVAGVEVRLAALRDGETTALAVLAERREGLLAHEAAGPPAQSAEHIAALLPEAMAARDAAQAAAADLRNRLKDDDRRRGEAADTRRRVAEQRTRHDLWRGMADLIGSADGAKFRRFAQGLTLDRLLALANAHLAELTPRYVLERAPGGDLDLQVRDRDMADEVRGVASLSGGERFLVSLSLALGLASMSGSRVLAESLFIDEGFGALDADSLDVAISALETLHASGRKVGVISHVQAMIDRIGVQIRVTKLGGGRSGIEVRAA